MNAERWRRVQALFTDALERETGAREAFLANACGGDEGLRHEVASLLAAHTAAGPPEAGEATRSWLRAAAPLVVGAEAPLERIGPYRIVRELGAGGMGRVYLAERDDSDDPDFRQRVAVKLARADLASARVEERFLRERRVLANLVHPNIARLLDGGTTSDGRPYFVMEYVDGRPIDVHCDAQRLDVDACLALFTGVCAAVQHAHVHLIVHRDLKASNILVTAAGQVKLLDFGVAKILEPETGGAHGLTQTDTAWMTPDYASPEQVRGEPVTTATDVYSLGVLLYRLLGGRAPYVLAGKSPAEIERAICETAPSRPSTAVGAETASLRRSTTERLRARLAGDLDTIVMKALHKEPGKRYGSAAEFAEDIDRHLRRLPVRARPDTAAYRLRKFVARHRVPVGAGVLVFAALVAGVISTTWQARMARYERDRVRIEEAKSRRAATFLADLFKTEDGAGADDRVTALELLDRGAARLRADGGDDPAVHAGMLSVTAGVYGNLGFFDRALALEEEAYAIRKRTLPADHVEIARSANALAVMLQGAGDFAGSEARSREAVEICRRQRQPDEATLFTAVGNIGASLLARRELDAAEPYFRESIALRTAAREPDPLGLAKDVTNLAALLSTRGEHDAADSLLREALQIRRAELGDDHVDVSHTLNNLGTSLIRRKRYAEAEVALAEALAIRERTFGPDHPETAMTLNNLASALEWQDRLEPAETYYRRSLEIKQQRLGREHPSVATGLNNLAGCIHKRGRLDEAARLYEECLAIRRKVFGPRHPTIATALGNVARVYEDRGERARAAAAWREVLTIRSAEHGADSDEVKPAKEALARLGG